MTTPTKSKLVTEDYPLKAVPREDRRSIWSLAPLLMGFTLTSTTLFAGGQLGPAFGFTNLLLIILVGNLILGTYCALLGYIAYKSGLTSVLMARFSFGNVGSRWVDFILGFTQIGWYAYTTALIAEVLNQLVGLPTSFNWLTILFFNYVFCSTAYFGYGAMSWLSRLAVPAMLILITLSLSIAVGDLESFTLLQTATLEDQLGLGAALTVIVATFISGGTNATNWTRFANSAQTAVWGTLAAFFLVNSLMVFAGAFGALVYENPDLVAVMAQQGLLGLGLILLLLNVWTTQDNTIYAFAVAGAHMFRSSKRTAFVLGGATVALILALAGIYDLFVPFLILLGTFIPPIGGVIIADFWLQHRGEFPSLDEHIPAFNWGGIFAYLAASAIAFYLPGIKPLNGILAAIVLYPLLNKILGPNLGRRTTL